MTVLGLNLEFQNPLERGFSDIVLPTSIKTVTLTSEDDEKIVFRPERGPKGWYWKRDGEELGTRDELERAFGAIGNALGNPAAEIPAGVGWYEGFAKVYVDMIRSLQRSRA